MKKTIGLLICLSAGLANAEVILSPEAVIQNTLGEWSDTLAVEFMIDRSGLTDPFVSGVTDFDTYVETSPTHVANMHGTVWGGAPGMFSGIVDFDLGAAYPVSALALWNDAHQDNSSSGIKNFNLYGSMDPDFNSVTDLGSFTGPLGPPHPDPIPVEVFNTTVATARYIRLEIVDHWGHPNVNIHELAFRVPEPATLTLLMLGSLVVGRKRK